MLNAKEYELIEQLMEGFIASNTTMDGQIEEDEELKVEVPVAKEIVKKIRTKLIM